MPEDRIGTLRLLTNDELTESPTLSGGGFDGPLPESRPSDRLEPWIIGVQTAADFAAAAIELGVPFQLAAIVVVERTLAEADLEACGAAGVIRHLDATAQASAVALELSEPQSAYLRALSRPLSERLVGSSRESRLRRSVALPMRLTERIGAADIDQLLKSDAIASALAWERAAVLEGRTMSEWAALRALQAPH